MHPQAHLQTYVLLFTKRDNSTKFSIFMNLLFRKRNNSTNFLVKETANMISGGNQHILNKKKETQKI